MVTVLYDIQCFIFVPKQLVFSFANPLNNMENVGCTDAQHIHMHLELSAHYPNVKSKQIRLRRLPTSISELRSNQRKKWFNIENVSFYANIACIRIHSWNSSHSIWWNHSCENRFIHWIVPHIWKSTQFPHILTF